MSGPPLTGQQVEDALQILEVMIFALEGDGSTKTLADVTPDEAARYIWGALNTHGYAIVKVRV